MDMVDSKSQAYAGVERRVVSDRRIKPDQRVNVRFDESGGDRRQGMGRRSSDMVLEILE